MVTKQQYIEYLVSSPANYTCTNLAAHLEGVSHDAVSDYLARAKTTARQLWELVQPLLNDTEHGYLIVDDSVQDKRYSRHIELVQPQYSGAEGGIVRGIGGIVRGIGVVNLIHTDGVDYYPIDFRIFAPRQDGKTKNDHFRDMLVNAVSNKRLCAKRVLFNSWYASVENLKLVVRLGLVFVTTLKSNRLVSLSKEGGYVHLDSLEWSEQTLRYGMVVKLKELPFKVRLFKVALPEGGIEWVITNGDRPDDTTTHVVQQENEVRCQVEQLHRELKQLTGIEGCQCRHARSKRTHIACCYHAWLSLKVIAKRLGGGKTVYQVRADLFTDYLRAQLRNPAIPAYGVA
jgi:hypothetical protein